MRRRILSIAFTGLAALSLALCLTLGVLWLRSCSRRDALRIVGSHVRTHVVMSVTFDWSRGGLRVGSVYQKWRIAGSPRTDELTADWTSFTPPRYPSFQHYGQIEEGRVFQIKLEPRLGFGLFAARLSDNMWSVYALSIIVPFWFATPITAILPAIWLRRHLKERRQRRFRRLGLCLNCGYDLRASEGRCSECGTPIPASTASKDVV